MAEQGTTTDFIQLINAMVAESIPITQPGQVLVIFDPPNTYERAVGLYFDSPEPEGGLDAALS